MVSLFRALLVVSTLLFAFGYMWPSLGASDEMVRLLQWDGLGATIAPSQVLTGCFLGAGVVIPAMMFFFVWWSRAAFAVLAVASLLGTFVWGLRVATPLASFLGQAVALCDGAILSIAYLTSVAKLFERPRT